MATDISTLQVQVRTNLDRLNKELKEATRNSANYSDEYKKLKRETDATYRSQLKFEQGLKAIGNQFQIDEANAEEYLQELHRLEQAHKTGGLASQGMGVDMRNLSYQVQDVAVQASMGTDALRIFSMQGPQIASAFGAGGAAFGAVIAIGGAIAGALLPSLLNGKDAAEELGEAMEDLGDILDMTGLQVNGITEEFAELVKQNRAIAYLTADQTLRRIQESAFDLRNEIVNLNSNLKVFVSQQGYSGAQRQLRAFAEAFGLTTEQATALAGALITFDGSADSINTVAGVLSYLRETAEITNEDFLELADTFTNLSTQQLLAIQASEGLTEALENLDGAAESVIGSLEEINVNEFVANIRASRLQISEAQTEALAMFQADSQFLTDYANQAAKELTKVQQIKAEQIRLGQEEVAQRKQQTTQLLAFSDMLLQGEGKNAQASARLGLNLLNAEKRANAGKILSDSYAAAMSAYKALAGIPLIGPALGAAASATILAAGVSYSAKSLSGRALGGQVRGGESYIVGERGPEVLTMGSSRGFITPNDQLRNQTINNNQGNTANVTFNIVANDTAGFDELLNKRRGQIIGIVNQALNNSGRRNLV